jgi:serine/threonine protein kinase/tetratricopeptide (TPR) repeat protein
MTTEPPSEQSIFLEAIEIVSTEERAAYLDGVCGGDRRLRSEVESLLAAHDRLGGFRRLADQHNASETADARLQSGSAGAVIGAYKLLQPIGEGGMGAVYMAEQMHPVQRKVALKIIRAGMDSRHVIARFEAERQALALMDHPNIAKVLDAGTTPQGGPYFVMELVKGVPITTYCDQLRLTPRQRLELFVPVCQAVQHAHQKAVIHRDLKPSNVLIALYDGRPVPKVIDFGVAKATGPKLTKRTLFTEFGSVVGTLEYMSPEQAELNQIDVDTRSDVYSLGVLLYELLTDTTPLERRRVKETSLLEVLRLIREQDPPRPSARLSTTAELPAIAASRGLEPAKLKGQVRGELDWIVMKALEKDRGRRYQTASALASDIERFLHDETVEACPPSTRYRLMKVARRHRTALATVCAFAGLLVLAAVVSTRQAVRAIRAEGKAYKAQTQAEANLLKAHQAVQDYFVLVSENALLHQPSLEPLRRQLLERALRYYEGFVQEKSEAPEIQAELAASYIRIAVLMHDLGLEDDWLPACRKAIDLTERLLRENADIAKMGSFREGVYRLNSSSPMKVSDADELIKTSERACLIWEELARRDPKAPGFRNELAIFHLILGNTRFSLGQFESALVSYRKSAELRQQLANEYPATAHYRAALAMSLCAESVVLSELGRTADAEETGQQALAEATRVVAEAPDVPAWKDVENYAHEVLGAVQENAGRLDDAIRTYGRYVASQESLLGKYPTVPRYRFRLLVARSCLAEALHAARRRPEAEEQYRQMLELGKSLSPQELDAQDTFAWFLATCPETRFRDPRRAIAIAEHLLDESTVAGYRASLLLTLGAARAAAGEWEWALRALKEIKAEPTVVVKLLLAQSYWRLGDKENARSCYKSADASIAKNRVRKFEVSRIRAATESMLELQPGAGAP